MSLPTHFLDSNLPFGVVDQAFISLACSKAQPVRAAKSSKWIQMGHLLTWHKCTCQCWRRTCHSIPFPHIPCVILRGEGGHVWCTKMFEISWALGKPWRKTWTCLHILVSLRLKKSVSLNTTIVIVCHSWLFQHKRPTECAMYPCHPSGCLKLLNLVRFELSKPP